MQSFVAFACVALFASVLCQKSPQWIENSKICTQKSDVTEVDAQKAIAGELKPADVTSNLKCYFLCMSEKEGYTKDGIVQPAVLGEKIVAYLNKEELAKAIAACKDIKGTDNCDTAYKLMTCVAQFKTKA